MDECGPSGRLGICKVRSLGSAGLLMATTLAEEYRLRAKDCAERAKLAPNPETKRQYEEMARQWLNLAKRAEEGGSGY